MLAWLFKNKVILVYMNAVQYSGQNIEHFSRSDAWLFKTSSWPLRSTHSSSIYSMIGCRNSIVMAVTVWKWNQFLHIPSSTAANISVPSTKERPVREREHLRIQTALRIIIIISHITPTSATLMSKADPYASGNSNLKEVMVAADTEKYSILRHLTILPRRDQQDGWWKKFQWWWNSNQRKCTQ